MNPVRIISRGAVSGSLRAARLPLDVVATLTPVGRRSARQAVDRIDATVRAVAGSLLGDEALREQARHRWQVVNARQRAAQLHEEAERTSERAEEKVEERHRQASRRRRTADTRARTRREQAQKRQQQRVRSAAEVEESRLEANRRVEAVVGEAIEEEAPRARLDATETEVEALRERERALTHADEAHRLKEAAERIKEERKQS